ncbi:MAG TPA: hypothetical protein VEQ63_07455 [Bryobacteraceae bacterium]|nr:hypothetical protein [Bryobacteraceae bacterium]
MFPRVFELPMGNARSDLRPNIGTYALSGLPETAALFDESALTAHYNGKSGLHVRLFQRVLETVTGRPRELLKQFYSIGSRSSLVRQARGSCISHVDVLTRVAMADFAIGQSLAPSLLQE